MRTAPDPISGELIVKHWQMLYHLVWELQSCSWPYAPEGYRYLRGRYGFKELFDYAGKDPRFIEEGFEWRQPPCAFYYRGETDAAAIALFLGKYVGTGLQGYEGLNKWLYAEIKGGPLRTWVEKQLINKWKDFDPRVELAPDKVAREFDFMDPSLFSSERVI